MTYAVKIGMDDVLAHHHNKMNMKQEETVWMNIGQKKGELMRM